MTGWVLSMNTDRDLLLSILERQIGCGVTAGTVLAFRKYENDEVRIGLIVNFGPVTQDYKGRPLCVMIEVCAFDRSVFNRKVLYDVFNFGFTYLGVRRIETLSPSDDRVIAKFNRQLGFKREGRLRGRFPDGRDADINGMFRNECRWLNYGIR